MLKVWGRTNSSNVKKVLWCAHELGQHFERVDIGGQFGGNKEPAYLALNPNGLVPTIEDDGLVLWESNTIVRYLVAKHKSPLLPTDLKVRAEAERWMDWQLTTAAPNTGPLLMGWIRTPAEKRDLAALEAQRKNAIAVWTILDQHLAGHTYVAGAAFTMGDIPIGAIAYMWFNLPIERPVLPNLEAWYKRLGERPGYAKYVMIPLT